MLDIGGGYPGDRAGFETPGSPVTSTVKVCGKLKTKLLKSVEFDWFDLSLKFVFPQDSTCHCGEVGTLVSANRVSRGSEIIDPGCVCEAFALSAFPVLHMLPLRQLNIISEPGRFFAAQTAHLLTCLGRKEKKLLAFINWSEILIWLCQFNLLALGKHMPKRSFQLLMAPLSKFVATRIEHNNLLYDMILILRYSDILSIFFSIFCDKALATIIRASWSCRCSKCGPLKSVFILNVRSSNIDENMKIVHMIRDQHLKLQFWTVTTSVIHQDRAW